MTQHRWIAVVLTLVGAAVSQSAFAFRCDGGLVTEGDSKVSVRAKCGIPTWTDIWREETIELPDTDFERSLVRINERWVYNPGPTKLLRIVTFRDGRVSAIETGGRGFSAIPGTRRCDVNSFALGVTSAEVAAKCGEPDSVERRYETISERIPGGRRKVSVSIEEWTFNLGPSRFIRMLTFRNGELIETKTGERGFPH